MMNKKVINFEQYRNHEVFRNLTEFQDRYEYHVHSSIVQQYFPNRMIAVQMDRCFVTVVKRGKLFDIRSILFFKEYWTVHEIVHWLRQHKIELFQPSNSTFLISGVNQVIDAKKINGYPIVLSEIGRKTILMDVKDLVEVTENYHRYDEIHTTERENGSTFEMHEGEH